MIHKNKLLLLSSAVIATTVIAAPIAEASTYTVSKGDNLTKIAKVNKVSVKQLIEWNKLKNDKVYVGQKLLVTNGTNKGTSSTDSKNKVPQKPTNTTDSTNKETQKTESNNFVSHKVIKGDTLAKIANKYSVTVASLKKINNITTDTIYIGQMLKLSESSVSQETGEPNTELNPKEVIMAEQAIVNQLAKEISIKSNPTIAGQATYEKVIEIATSLINTPYLFAGNTPTGFDCSGFVKYVYSTAGVDISRKSSEDYFMNNTTVVENPVPGDVVFFKNTYKEGISHMGIYLGDGQFIHAGSNGVQLSKISYEYWQSKFVAYKRFNQLIN